MQHKIRWGILGCGNIAAKFAADLSFVEDAVVTSVASRSLDKAKAFAVRFGAAHAYGSYEELARDPEVDVIYVATPHSHHYENTLLCLNHDKATLCEKAFALNSWQAHEMIDLAKKRKVFLMEALWTKFLPHYIKLQEILKAGTLGDITSVIVNFGFVPTPPVPARVFDPALGGGTMLDIGIYNVFMAMSVLGRPDHIDAYMKPASTGIDAQCAVLFRYNNGSMAQLFSSFEANLAMEADIAGNKGRIRVTHRFYAPDTVIEYYSDKPDSLQVINVERETGGHGYEYEARHVGECLRKGLLESPVMTHADTLMLMEVLDEIRRKAGIVYSADKV
ncbi:MAG: Gfo/Idh/MocA family oxidoreductase [Flavitalea sp.]